MPYITKTARQVLDAGQDAPMDAGELNYAVTKLCLSYLDEGAMSYRRLNEIIGVLECAKLEVYRRMVAPYEDEKMAESGDVYPVGGG